MVSIETEFYDSNKSGFATPFPSLISLDFYSMPQWQEWCLFEGGAFPQLRKLSLYDCPKLVGYLPKHLPALEYLEIKKCQQLTSYIPKARLYDHISIGGSEVVLQAEEGAISVKNLCIEGSKKLSSFPIDGFPNIETLSICCCENLESIVSQSALQSIILECNPKDPSSSGGLPALNMTRLTVFECPKLKSLPRHMDRLLPNLKMLDIRGCPEIEWPGEGVMPPNLTEWPELTIDDEYDNGSVQCFPEQGLLPPSSLNSLWLCNLQTLKTLDHEGFLHLLSLQKLLISGCPKLEKIEGQRLPSPVEHLKIHRLSFA